MSIIFALCLALTMMPFGAAAAVMRSYDSIDDALASGELTAKDTFIVNSDRYIYYGDYTDEDICFFTNYANNDTDTYDIQDLGANAIFKFGDGYLLITNVGENCTKCDAALHNAEINSDIDFQLDEDDYGEDYYWNITLEGDTSLGEDSVLWVDNIVFTGSGNFTVEGSFR